MRYGYAVWAVLTLGPTVWAADVSKANALTPQEIADGWLMLFDGETTYGWQAEGDAAVKDGLLVVGGPKPTRLTSSFQAPDYVFRLEYEARAAGLEPCRLHWGEAESHVLQGKGRLNAQASGGLAHASALRIEVPAGGSLAIRSFFVKPLDLKPIFNGKDLLGWKVFPGEKYKSKYTVTPEGWINVKNGPGDLQTEKEYADFVLQLDCISNGKALNSGVFFRCLPDEYQQGYEMQIQNGYKDGDRTKPADYGTGAIYRRVPARKVVSNDHEWFTMTLVAHGNHIATWVNGYQTVDWTDTRPPHENPRNGSKTGPGHISLQGHDPTTDLSFRNLRIAEMPKR